LSIVKITKVSLAKMAATGQIAQNGARRPIALRPRFQVKIKKPRHEKFGLEIVEEVYFAENRRRSIADAVHS
jgi:hypothetical protein